MFVFCNYIYVKYNPFHLGCPSKKAATARQQYAHPATVAVLVATDLQPIGDRCRSGRQCSSRHVDPDRPTHCAEFTAQRNQRCKCTVWIYFVSPHTPTYLESRCFAGTYLFVHVLWFIVFCIVVVVVCVF